MPPKQGKHGSGKFILPADPRGFQDSKYWDQFFASRKTAFEWYGNFMDSAEVLCKYIKGKDDILVFGCGNSEISAQMYYIGLKKITNVDISQVVVDKMTKKYAEQCPDMLFVKDDITKLETVADSSFSVVLDKATFDALIADESASSLELAAKICSEVDRVLKFGGRYICITLAQRHVLTPLLVNMANKGFAIRAHVIDVQSDQSEQINDVVFCLVFTKMKPGGPLICDIQLNSSQKLSRMEDLQQFIKRLQEHQYINSLARCLKFGRYDAVEGECLKIFSGDVHKYTLYPFQPATTKPKFSSACFIIPPGRSRSYLYGTQEGRKTIAEDNISAQLVMFVEVMPVRGQAFSFELVKDEITPHLRKLTPAKLFDKMIFMTDGAFPETDSLVPGDEIVHEGSSPTTGEYRIYDRRLPGEEEFERRLVFLDQPHITQTEIHLKKDLMLGAGGSPDRTITFNYGRLSSDYQRSVIAAMVNHSKLLGPDPQPVRVLLVGLGGGMLASFIHHNFPSAVVEAVELDPSIVEISIRFFGLPVDERCGCHVDDGLRFMLEAMKRGEKYDVVIVDADTKDPKLPLRCPPAEFVSPENLEVMLNLLDVGGMVIINVVTRVVSIVDAIKAEMLDKFGNILHAPTLEDELNHVLFSLHRSYFDRESQAAITTGENHLRSRTGAALAYWMPNLKRFNQILDEKYGEILVDGASWWRKVELQLSRDFMVKCGIDDMDEATVTDETGSTTAA